MPELPEVETIRRQLEPAITGRRVERGGSHPSAKFAPAALAAGAVVTGVDRRGKYLLIGLARAGGSPTSPSADQQLVIHLGMTGALRLSPRPTDASPRSDPYVRAWWDLDDGHALELRDVRRFGRVAVVAPGDHVSLPTLHRLGPEPLGADFTVSALHAAVRRSQVRLKTQLLNQRVVAGVGNIYADEALWRAGLNPAARTVSRPAAVRLHEAVRHVLTVGLDHGGTMLRDYRTMAGDTGENQHHLQCYGQAGRPCPRCGTLLRRRLVDGRGTTWCPHCQRR